MSPHEVIRWLVDTVSKNGTFLLNIPGKPDGTIDRKEKLILQKVGEWFKQHFDLWALPEFATGVGIHTGDLMEVRIGPPGAEDLTVVGDSVNVASRLGRYICVKGGGGVLRAFF